MRRYQNPPWKGILLSRLLNDDNTMTAHNDNKRNDKHGDNTGTNKRDVASPAPGCRGEESRGSWHRWCRGFRRYRVEGLCHRTSAIAGNYPLCRLFFIFRLRIRETYEISHPAFAGEETLRYITK